MFFILECWFLTYVWNLKAYYKKIIICFGYSVRFSTTFYGVFYLHLCLIVSYKERLETAQKKKKKKTKRSISEIILSRSHLQGFGPYIINLGVRFILYSFPYLLVCRLIVAYLRIRDGLFMFVLSRVKKKKNGITICQRCFIILTMNSWSWKKSHSRFQCLLLDSIVNTFLV